MIKQSGKQRRVAIFNPLTTGITNTSVQPVMSTNLAHPTQSYVQPQNIGVKETAGVPAINKNAVVTAATQESYSATAFLEGLSQTVSGVELTSDVSIVDTLTKDTVLQTPPPSELSRIIQDLNRKSLDQEAPIAFVDSEGGDETGADEAQQSFSMRL